MNQVLQTQKAKRIFFALLTIFLWASSYIAVRYAASVFSPYAMTFLRFFFSALTVLVMMPFYKVKKPALRDLPLFFFAALAAYSLYAFLMALGAKTVTASVASFITAFSPVLTPVFALLFLKEHMSRLRWISVGIGFLGVLVMLFSDASFSIQSGVLWVLLSATLFSLYNIIQRKLLMRYTGFEVTAYATLLGALTLLPFLPTAVQEGRVAPIGASLVLLLLGVISAVAYIFWAMALKMANHTAEVTNFMFLTPVLTTILGFVLIGELPPVSTFFGGGLMLFALVLTNLEPRKGRAEGQVQELVEEKQTLAEDETATI